jgi:hypothetical protein
LGSRQAIDHGQDGRKAVIELSSFIAYRTRIANGSNFASEVNFLRSKEAQNCEKLLQFMQSH